MAIKACTIQSLTEGDTLLSLLSITTISTSTGVKIDVTDKKMSKLIILAKRDNSTEAASLVVQTSTKSNIYSETVLGDRTVMIATGDTASRQQLRILAPQTFARFKDTDEQINLSCTGSTAILGVAAILLP